MEHRSDHWRRGKPCPRYGQPNAERAIFDTNPEQPDWMDRAAAFWAQAQADDEIAERIEREGLAGEELERLLFAQGLED